LTAFKLCFHLQRATLLRGLTQLAAFRPPVRTGIPALDSPEVDGLHFVGASTRPGNGVPLVLMGVKVVFEKIMELHGAGVKTMTK
jgi:phytoene desaturase (3,4-didehydrolycopene-forming)